MNKLDNKQLNDHQVREIVKQDYRELLYDVLEVLSFRTGRFKELGTLDKKIDEFISTLKIAVNKPHLSVELEISQNIYYSGYAINKAIYGIICEALLNSVNHGKADKININIKKEINKILISINDNGCGSNAGKITSDDNINEDTVSSKGIINRLISLKQFFGATYEFNSIKNKGTEINASIPLVKELCDEL